MKLQIKQISLLALATLVLAACSNDGDSLPENPLPADRLIRVIAAVNSPATRAGATTDNLHSFGLFIVNDKDSAYSYQNVYMNKEDDGTWKGYKNADKESLDTPMMWESAGRPAERHCLRPPLFLFFYLPIYRGELQRHLVQPERKSPYGGNEAQPQQTAREHPLRSGNSPRLLCRSSNTAKYEREL